MAFFAVLWVWITDHATVLSTVIAAISTFFIAGFTISLVKTSSRQGQLTERAVELAHDEFVATHRPKIIIREVYWDPDQKGALTIMLGNNGSRTAKIVEFRTEFNRTDERPIMHEGPSVTKDWIVERGAFEALTIRLSEYDGFALGAFDEGFLEKVDFQGLIIYADDAGTLYRAVFKRTCHKDRSVFRRTGDPDDEYSD